MLQKIFCKQPILTYCEKAKLVETVKQADLERLSLLRSPRGGIAIFEIPSCEAEADKSMASLPSNNLLLSIDGIQDPGNLGTIIALLTGLASSTFLHH